MNYLLDTCVISELTRRDPNARVVAWLRAARPNSLYLSVITIGELKKGIARRNDDARALELEAWLDERIRADYSDRILPVDEEVALQWGRLSGIAERAGRKRPAVDALIAATASIHHLTIVTRNVSDFSGMGLKILNPFKPLTSEMVKADEV